MSLTAEVKWPSENSIERTGFRGCVKISQDHPNANIKFKVKMEGLKPNKLFGFHIHEKAVTSWEDLNKSCESCGGHFNPLNQDHGSVLNEFPDMRHAGDLINNVRSNGVGRVNVEFEDNLAALIPSKDRPYTIIGKSLVVHAGTDDLGRQGISKAMPYIDAQSIVHRGTTEENVVFYDCPKKRKSSLTNGNAGARIACGNIIPTCSSEIINLYL